METVAETAQVELKNGRLSWVRANGYPAVCGRQRCVTRPQPWDVTTTFLHPSDRGRVLQLHTNLTP